MDLVACELEARFPFGLLIRLAKDCELVETWSSGVNFGRWVPRDGPGLVEVVVRRDEYD